MNEEAMKSGGGVVPNVRLANGVMMPAVGFGTYKAPDDKEGERAVTEAIGCGYRLIDTAAMYANERAVGRGMRESGVGRSDLFVTTKLANADRGYDSALRAFDRSMDALGLEYLDLYLIHWPASAGKTDNWREINASTWRAMESLLDSGRVRAIGVSNFMPEHLEALAQTARVLPMVNQIEFHPGWMQKPTLDWCQAHGIVVEGWSPLGRTRLFGDPLLNELAAKYDRSVAQICLRWAFQHGVVPIPKSLHKERMVQNLNIFDFQLSAEDMARIDAMPPTGESGLSPDTITF